MQRNLFHAVFLHSSLCIFAAASAGEERIPNGSFDNDPSGWINQVVNTPGVVSEWGKDAGRNSTGGVHIRSEKGGNQAIWIWRCKLSSVPTDRSLRVSGWAKGREVESLAAICVQGWDEEHTRIVDFATTQTSAPLTGDFDWTRIETTLSPSDATRDVHVLIFISGKGQVWFDDVSAEVVDRVAGGSQVGAAQNAPGLYEARGAYRISASSEVARPTMLMPLPLCYREQAPLTYDLWTEPAGRIADARVYKDKLDNYVAEVVLSSLASGDEFELHWSSIVLVGERSFDDVPAHAILPPEWDEDSRPWLADTRSAQAGHERIKSLAAEIRGGSKDVFEIISATIEACRNIYSRQSGRCTALDAVQALDKQGSCTSCANLVAALLRANNIPARILAGYAPWAGPQQTHYIVEAMVPGYGWYPIESTALQAPWQPYKHIAVSIVPPEYEDRSAGRSCAADGVPYLSLTEHPEAAGFMCLGILSGPLGCDHEAKLFRAFPDASKAEWEQAVELAGRRWNTWLGSSPRLGKDAQRLSTPLAKDKLIARNPAELAALLK